VKKKGNFEGNKTKEKQRREGESIFLDKFSDAYREFSRFVKKISHILFAHFTKIAYLCRINNA